MPLYAGEPGIHRLQPKGVATDHVVERQKRDILEVFSLSFCYEFSLCRAITSKNYMYVSVMLHLLSRAKYGSQSMCKSMGSCIKENSKAIIPAELARALACGNG